VRRNFKGVHLFRKRERHTEREIVVVSSQAGDQEEEDEWMDGERRG
jgi:hypothetical protein